MKKIILLISLVALFCSCKVTTSSVKTFDIQGAVVQTPLMADLEVNPTKVKAVAHGENLEAVKIEAMAEALRISNADVLVHPQYKAIGTNGDVTVTATGYPAIYKNFRNMTAQDTSIVITSARVGLYKEPVLNAATDSNTKAKKWVLLGGLGVALITLLLIL